jgi:hypothetical protein
MRQYSTKCQLRQPREMLRFWRYQALPTDSATMIREGFRMRLREASATITDDPLERTDSIRLHSSNKELSVRLAILNRFMCFAPLRLFASHSLSVSLTEFIYLL